MTADIYKLHETAFARVSAFVILDKKGERVATVAIKFPADGSGRLWAYVHVIGLPMVRAYAGGYGYDKRSAAVSSAFARIKSEPYVPEGESIAADWRSISHALDRGDDWTRALEKAWGVRVLQAV